VSARALLATAVVTAAVAGLLATGRGRAVTVRETSLEQSYAVAINAARAAHGLAPLTVEPALVVSARGQSARLLATNTFEHGNSWWKRILDAGSTGTQVGENLGWCAPRLCPDGSPDTLVRMWLESPEHRENVLNPRFDHIGVGIRVGTFTGYAHAYVVTTDFDG
jgi:uncharacterized protein YkwD